jgi:hypothetical protein
MDRQHFIALFSSIATALSRCSNVRGGLLDNLSRLREDWCRDFKANYLGGLEADDELKIGWELDRQFSRIGALEDLVHVICCSAVLISEVDPV